jgi:glycerol-3-phosphate dehydrogenase (NAD(P)+)
MKVSVIGAGAWGTALAVLLSQREHQVTLWGHDPNRLEEIRRTQFNESYLPGVPIPSRMRLEPKIQAALANCELAVIAVPSRAFREVTQALAGFQGIAVSVTKGIEKDTGLTMSGILAETAPHAKAGAMSGPTLAAEVARGIPAAIVAAAGDEETALEIQGAFHGPAFRVYTSTDLPGVEFGGALKNIIAIGAGVGDGLGLGDNTKAALMTRAIVEIRRLGVACGARAETFSGLSGLGDLAVTCFSRLSRNRQFGERIGRGERVADILASTVTVAEGYPTAQAAYELARTKGIETPIMEQVYAMLYEEKNVAQALQDLMQRDSKAEHWI